MNNDAGKMAVVEAKKPILILSGTGKTGRRVAERLPARGLPILAQEDMPAREPRGFAEYARDAAATGVWGGSR